MTARTSAASARRATRAKARPKRARGRAARPERKVTRVPLASGARCRCPGCKAGLTPFTVPHFRAYCAELVLDNEARMVLEPFQEAVAEDVFSGIVEIWEVIPEGNGKTTFWAAMGLYHCEHRAAAFVPIAASSRDQAETYYRQCEAFVENTPRVKKIFDAQQGYRRVRLKRQKRVRIQVFAADENTGDSLIFTLAIVDEGHRHRNLGLYRTWRGKAEKRPGAQIAMISTGGELGGEFEQTRARILESTPVVERRRCFVRARTKQIVIHDYAIPEDGNPEDLELVKEANPLSTITVESLRKKRLSPTMTLSHWRRLTCNRGTRAEDAAITEAEWANAATDVRIAEGTPIELGMDAGWKWDTFAMVPLWARDAGFRLLGPASVLVPPRDGTSLEPKKVKEAFLAIHERNPIERVVMDITHANDIAGWIREQGIEVLEWSQGDVQQAKDYDAFMEGLRGGTLRHSADPALTEHAMNAIAKELLGGRHKFERKSSSRNAKKQERRVIDALAAASMVHSAAAAADHAPSESRDLPSSSSTDMRPMAAGILERRF